MQELKERKPLFRREYFPGKQRSRHAVDVSVILPTYNERENLSILIPTLIRLFEEAHLSFELIVVDDNSPDHTYDMVRQMAMTDHRLRLIRRIDERGLSSAVVTGMASAGGRHFIVMDSDLQHDESVIPRMVQELQNAEIVVGSRMAESGSYGEMSWIRKMMSLAATMMAKIMLPVGVSDPMSGFFGVRRETFEQIADRLNPKGFKILLEILARAKGREVREVGYRFRNRMHGQTKLDGAVIMQYVFALVEIRLGRTLSTTFFRYALIGSAGVLVNLLGQFLATALFGLEYQRGTLLRPSLAVLIGFELSVYFNYMANNSWTFKDRKRTGFTSNLAGFGKFHVVALYGFLIQVSVWNLLLAVTPDQIPAQAASYGANLIGILFATVNNYYLNKNFTWERGLTA